VIAVVASAVVVAVIVAMLLLLTLRTPRQRTVKVEARRGGRIGTAALPGATFADGTVVQLEGISADGRVWWGADGRLIRNATTRSARVLPTASPGERRSVLVRFRLQGENLRGKDFRPRFANEVGVMTNPAWDGPYAITFDAMVTLPASPARCDLEFGQAVGGWKSTLEAPAEMPSATAAATTPATMPTTAAGTMATSTPATMASSAPSLRIGMIAERAGKTEVEFFDERPMGARTDVAWRLIVITKDVKAVRLSGLKTPRGRIVFVYDVPLKDVARASYQVRDVEWQRLGSIALEPKFTTGNR
jgi:hypothetical protein